MEPHPPIPRVPRMMALVWALSVSLSILAAGAVLALTPHWHTATQRLVRLSQGQAWLSIALCVGLLLMSQRKHQERLEAWAQPVLLWVLGGFLCVLLQHFALLPQWLAQPHAVWRQLQMVVLVLLQWGCALACVRQLRRASLTP